MRTVLALSLVCSVGCLGTSTGNPFDPDASHGADSGFPASDSGPAVDAGLDVWAASDSGPAFDSGPNLDGGPGADASGADAGFDAGCMDAGVTTCGTMTQPGCDCLAGPTAALGDGTPLTFADQAADDGRVTLVRAAATTPADGTESLEAVVVASGAVEASTPIATGAFVSAAVAGDAISVAWVEENDATRTLSMSEVAVESGAVTAPALLLSALPHPVTRIDVARKASSTMVAYISATSNDAGDGDSVFVLAAPVGMAGPDLRLHGGGGALRALAIAEAPVGWLLAYADDESVYTQVLDEAGAAVGEATQLAASMGVDGLELVSYGDGFALAFDGSAGALHLLSAEGASTASLDLDGTRIFGLGSSGEALMVVGTENGMCAADSSLLFIRVDASLMPLHLPVRVGVGTDAVVAVVDGAPRVALASDPALSLVEACLPSGT